MGNCAASIMSNVIYFSEKFSMFLSFTMLISCSIICMLCMLAFGIGLGYNYSYVDYRSKHVYIAGGHKKERPTNYYGPGQYKPTTMDPRYTTKPKRKKTTQRWWYGRRRARKEGPKPEIVEYTYDSPEDLPHQAPSVTIQNVIAPQLRIKPKYFGPRLEGLYFTTVKVKLRLTTDIPLQSDATVELTTDIVSVSKDIDVDKFDLRSNALNDSDVNVNATQNVKGPESITVNVTKTSDSAPPFVLKTMMHQDQLMKWLSRLQDANKTFAVHVITN